MSKKYCTPRPPNREFSRLATALGVILWAQPEAEAGLRTPGRRWLKHANYTFIIFYSVSPGENMGKSRIQEPIFGGSRLVWRRVCQILRIGHSCWCHFELVGCAKAIWWYSAESLNGGPSQQQVVPQNMRHCLYIYTYIHIHTYTYMYIYMYVYIYIYICT